MDSHMRDRTFTEQQWHLTTSIETLVEATLHIFFQSLATTQPGPNIRPPRPVPIPSQSAPSPPKAPPKHAYVTLRSRYERMVTTWWLWEIFAVLLSLGTFSATLSHFIWLLFSGRTRQLKDLQLYDEASRGPLGSSALLMSEKGWWVRCEVHIIPLLTITKLLGVSRRPDHCAHPCT